MTLLMNSIGIISVHLHNMAAYFNPNVITLKLLISGDVELNPGDDNKDHESEQLKLPNRGLRIGQWNIEHLTDTKFEQISLILKTCNNIDIFLLETFSNQIQYTIFQATIYIGKIETEPKPEADYWLMLLTESGQKECTNMKMTALSRCGLMCVLTNQIDQFWWELSIVPLLQMLIPTIKSNITLSLRISGVKK